MNNIGYYIRWFEKLSIEDIPLVDGKNASLGEMYRELRPQGVKVPNGFAITAEAYRYMLDKAEAWEVLHETLDRLDPDNIEDLARCGALARKLVYGATLPDDMGLTNVILMIPFCRRVQEGERALQAMADNGLKHSENGL